MTSESGSPDQSPEPHGGAVPPRRKRASKNNAWLYVILGVVIGGVGVVGLLGDDRSFLDWLLIALGLINLAIGVKVLTIPDEPFHDPQADDDPGAGDDPGTVR